MRSRSISGLRLDLSLSGQGGAQGPASQRWDPGHKSPNAVLTNGDTRVVSLNTGSNYGATRGLRACAGLCYFSMTVEVDAGGSVCGGGVADATVNMASGTIYGGESASGLAFGSPNGNVFVNSVNLGTIGVIPDPGNVEVAVRVGTRRVWIRLSGGAWLGGGDPAADTTPTATLAGTGDIFPTAWVSSVSPTAGRYTDIHPTAGTTTGTAPSGFTAANWL